jgi:hypothetical protein
MKNTVEYYTEIYKKWDKLVEKTATSKRSHIEHALEGIPEEKAEFYGLMKKIKQYGSVENFSFTDREENVLPDSLKTKFKLEYGDVIWNIILLVRNINFGEEDTIKMLSKVHHTIKNGNMVVGMKGFEDVETVNYMVAGIHHTMAGVVFECCDVNGVVDEKCMYTEAKLDISQLVSAHLALLDMVMYWCNIDYSIEEAYNDNYNKLAVRHADGFGDDVKNIRNTEAEEAVVKN